MVSRGLPSSSRTSHRSSRSSSHRGEGEGMLSRASSQPPLPQQAVPEGAPAAALAWLGLGFLWLLARVLLGFSSIFGLWLRAWLWLWSSFDLALARLWLDLG